jgi:PPOX class probable F420-dependent enzyme
MASRRNQISMTPEEIDAFLHEGRQVLNVATIGPTGHPHLVAMWFEFLDGAPAFWTFAKSQKVVNLRRDPKITGLVEAGDTYSELKGVELVGSGVLVDDYDTVLEFGARLGQRYQGVPAAEARPFLEAQARKRIVVKIDVERFVSWDHAKLGGTY